MGSDFFTFRAVHSFHLFLGKMWLKKQGYIFLNFIHAGGGGIKLVYLGKNREENWYIWAKTGNRTGTFGHFTLLDMKMGKF